LFLAAGQGKLAVLVGQPDGPERLDVGRPLGVEGDHGPLEGLVPVRHLALDRVEGRPAAAAARQQEEQPQQPMREMREWFHRDLDGRTLAPKGRSDDTLENNGKGTEPPGRKALFRPPSYSE